LKDQPGWRLKQTRPGLFVWTTPTGENHAVDQEPLIDYDMPSPSSAQSHPDSVVPETVVPEPAPF
ncbi:MAG: hypothetical protein ACRDSQ_01030, partial [Actinokineospora sp.]